MLEVEDIFKNVDGNLSSIPTEPLVQVGISVKLDRVIALNTNACPELLVRLARSSDKQTLRNVVLNPQTPTVILIELAPRFPGEFFLNPVFDLLLMENPSLLFELPGGVLKNILKRPDCPYSLLHWAARHGDKWQQLALVGRSDISLDLLRSVANGPHVKSAEAAAGRLLTG